jgi:hypothetical protein
MPAAPLRFGRFRPLCRAFRAGRLAPPASAPLLDFAWTDRTGFGMTEDGKGCVCPPVLYPGGNRPEG